MQQQQAGYAPQQGVGQTVIIKQKYKHSYYNNRQRFRDNLLLYALFAPRPYYYHGYYHHYHYDHHHHHHHHYDNHGNNGNNVDNGNGNANDETDQPVDPDAPDNPQEDAGKAKLCASAIAHVWAVNLSLL